MSKQEQRNNERPNLMTRFTKEILEKELKELEEKRLLHLREIGDAAGAGGDYHDNFGFEEAHRKFDIASSQLATLRDKLINVEIIESRKEADSIGIGNSVTVRFADESTDEIFTILGPDDGGKKPGWLSHASPLGIGLLGKKVGDSVEYEISKGKSQRVLVKAILPGNF